MDFHPGHEAYRIGDLICSKMLAGGDFYISICTLRLAFGAGFDTGRLYGVI